MKSAPSSGKTWLAVLALCTLAGCDRGFDAAAWRAQRGNAAAENSRSGMLADLRPLLRPGMPRSEVEALLGPPDLVAKGRVEYAIGLAAYAADYQTFAVYYDDGGRLVRTGVIDG